MTMAPKTPPQPLLVRLPRTASWRFAVGVPLAVLLGVLVAQVLLILVRNGGVFTYTLDDPYIHLALAEGLQRGTYGLNPDEFSAPSSSVLWPFLLVPWAGFAFADWVPLAYNMAAAAATVWVVARVLEHVLEADVQPRRYRAVALLATVFVLMTHTGGLVLNGLEHSLQVLLAVLTVWGLAQEREGALPRWLPAVLVLGPLVRYEMLALAAPALLYLFVRGHRRSAFVAGGVLAAVLAGFAAFLLANGTGPLPNSVMVKSFVAEQGGSGALANLAANLKHEQAFVILGALLLALGAVLSSRLPSADRMLASWTVAVAGLHLLAGRFGWVGRYEVYAWAATLLMLLVVYRAPLRTFVAHEPLWKTALLALALLALVTPRYVLYWARAPHIAHNVFGQHYQMHRFATDFWQQPVAANDIGWLAFRNEHYILDLEGLASTTALANRGGDGTWVGPEAARHDVRLAIVHEGWSGSFPPAWVPVGALVLEGPRMMITDPVMAFYARDAATAAEARPLLEHFRATLPPDSRFVFDDEAPHRLMR